MLAEAAALVPRLKIGRHARVEHHRAGHEARATGLHPSFGFRDASHDDQAMPENGGSRLVEILLERSLPVCLGLLVQLLHERFGGG